MKGLAGTGTLFRLILRRDRILLPIWILWFAALPTFFATGFEELYPTAAARQAFADTAGSNPGLVALYGPLFDSSIGGLLAWRAGIIPVVLAVVSLLTVIRHTRTEEEAGRRELLGSAVVGRHAPLAAALTATVAANLVLAALLALGLISEDLPVSGSIALGLSYAAVGGVFAAVAAVAAQLTESAGTARGLAISVLGLAVLLRGAGDVSGGGSLSWLSWASPIGWSQQVRAYADERWWVFALALCAFVLLAAVAYALSSRRDVGSGLLPPRPGPPAASPALHSPLALAWRLHRGLLLGWSAGFIVMGVMFGGVTESVSEMLDDNPQLQTLFEQLGGRAGLADAYLAAMMGLLGLVASGYAIQAALRLRSEEEDLRAQPVLATAVGRLRWSSSHLIFAFAGPALTLVVGGLATGVTYGLSIGDVQKELPRVLGAVLVQLPAAWVLAGITVALFGLLPRLAAFASWGVLGVFLLLGQFGELLQLEQWMLDLSPFTHVPNLPGGEVSAGPLVWLVVVAAALTVAGLFGFHRRDIQ
ncbi:MAG: ABC transporter permease [Rubrobacteraceae bacterium]